jgi:hypothetical protein
MAIRDARHDNEVTNHPGPIPGEHEHDTLAHAEPGAMGGGVAGERLRPTSEGIALSEEDREELQREGSGGRSTS